MCPLKIHEQIYSASEQKGCRAKVIPVSRIRDVKDEIESYHRQGIFDETFYRDRLGNFEFDVPASYPEARCIIVASAPQPQQKVKFSFRGNIFHFIIPLTYSHETDRTVENILLDVLRPAGFTLRRLRLPVKLVAVRSGLAKYGKNNITYIENMGSFHRLVTFLTDIPAEGDSWQKLELMEQCKKCNACVKKCPTGSITPDRFIIRAERCLTFCNESPNDLPDWVRPSWHNSLIGCMTCQLVCPVNKKQSNWFEEKEEFTEDETELILSRRSSRKQLSSKTMAKLKRLYLWEDFELLSRNLGVLIKRNSSQ